MKSVVWGGVLLVMLFANMAGAAGSGVAERVSILEQQLEATWLSRVDISGAVEIEASYTDDYDGVQTSDIDLTNVEIGIDAGFSELVGGFVVFKWEEDGEEGVFVDEGGITLGNLETLHYQITAGKLYVPFGVFETNMISDPLTLELGEIREGAVSVEFSKAGFYGAAFAFNSDVSKTGKADDMIDSWGLSLGYQFAGDAFSADLKAGYVSNLNASGGFSDTFDSVDDYSAGATGSLVVGIADFTLVGEYLTALDDDYLTDSNNQSSAWNVEVSYSFTVNERAAAVALGYQGTREAAFLGLPEQRWLVSANYELTPELAIAVELSQDDDYATHKGGSGETAETVLAQLALAF